jgi:hypothetical protein
MIILIWITYICVVMLTESPEVGTKEGFEDNYYEHSGSITIGNILIGCITIKYLRNKYHGTSYSSVTK